MAVINNKAEFAPMWRNTEITIGEIAAHYDVSETTVYSAATRFKLPTAGECGRKKGVRPQSVDLAALEPRYVAGENVDDLAVDFKIPIGRIYGLASKHGWKRRNKTRAPRNKPVRKVAVAQKIKMPSAKAQDASFTLRRLDMAQIEALAESGGRYEIIEQLAGQWGKSRVFVGQCWHDYNAVVA